MDTRVLCREIVVDGYAVGTMDIMEYADAHPNEYFDYTDVRSSKTNYGKLMVSEYEPTDTDKAGEAEGLMYWHDLPNGWQRESNMEGVWVCRKNDRYIIITT